MTRLQRVILGPRDRERNYGIRAASSELDPTHRSALNNFLLRTRAVEPPHQLARAFFPLEGKDGSIWCAAQIEVSAIGRDDIVVVDAILLSVEALRSIDWATDALFAAWPEKLPEGAKTISAAALPTPRGSRATDAGRDLAMLLPTTLKVDPDIDLNAAIGAITGEISGHMRSHRSYCSSAEIPAAFSEGAFDLVLVHAHGSDDETRYTRNGLYISRADRRSAQNVAVELELAIARRLRKLPASRLPRDIEPAVRAVLARHRDVKFADLLEIVTSVAPRDEGQRLMLANVVDDEFETTIPRSAKEAAGALEKYWRFRPQLGEVTPAFALRLAMETGSLFLLPPEMQRQLFERLLESKDFSAKAVRSLKGRAIASIEPVIDLALAAGETLRLGGRDDLVSLVLEALNAVADDPAAEPSSVEKLAHPMEILIKLGRSSDLAACVDTWVVVMKKTIPSHTKNCLRAAARALNRHMAGTPAPRMSARGGDVLELHLALSAAARHIGGATQVR